MFTSFLFGYYTVCLLSVAAWRTVPKLHVLEQLLFHRIVLNLPLQGDQGKTET